jgi:hypothetical protein
VKEKKMKVREAEEELEDRRGSGAPYIFCHVPYMSLVSLFLHPSFPLNIFLKYTVHIYPGPSDALSWFVDRPFMIVGADVSHPPPGAEGASLAALAATVNRRADFTYLHVYIHVLYEREEKRGRREHPPPGAEGASLAALAATVNRRVLQYIIMYNRDTLTCSKLKPNPGRIILW